MGLKRIKWPKGKYNGQRVEGFQITFVLHLLYWKWVPILYCKFGLFYTVWLCFTVRCQTEYERE